MMQNQDQWQEYIRLVKPISPFAEPTVIPVSPDSGIFPVKDEAEQSAHSRDVPHANAAGSIAAEEKEGSVVNEMQGSTSHSAGHSQEAGGTAWCENVPPENTRESDRDEVRDKVLDADVPNPFEDATMRSEHRSEDTIDESFPRRVLHETRFEPQFIPEEIPEGRSDHSAAESPAEKMFYERSAAPEPVPDEKQEARSEPLVGEAPSEKPRVDSGPPPQFAAHENVAEPASDAALRDAALRAKLDLENVRRRSQEELARAQKFAIEGFAEALLPVKDSLEAALKIETPTLESLKEGVEMTLKQLSAAFEKSKLTEISPAPGEKLDPMKHQAISVVPVEENPNTIVQVVQKGYMIADRLLRPALVTVGQQKASEGGS
jgi:molecular chaperone GrpE